MLRNFLCFCFAKPQKNSSVACLLDKRIVVSIALLFTTLQTVYLKPYLHSSILLYTLRLLIIKHLIVQP